MAEGGYNPNTNYNQLCRYFLHGSCRRGNDCNFVHSRDGTAPLNNICKYYQFGKCSYGKNCRYDHVKTSTRSASSNSRCDIVQSSNSSTSSASRHDLETQPRIWSPPDSRDRRETHSDRRNHSNGGSPSNMSVLKQGGLERILADATDRIDRTLEELRAKTRSASSNSRCDIVQSSNSSTSSTSRHDLETQPRSLVLPSFKDMLETRSDRCNHSNGGSPSNMVVLKKGGLEKSLADATEKKMQRASEEMWVKKAQDFVPGRRCHNNTTYASTTKSDLPFSEESACPFPDSGPTEEGLLCPYFAHGNCPYEDRCQYVHGDVCDICQYPRLHPTDEVLREAHRKECVAEMEQNMEYSFAVQESEDKECCICLEMVMEKAGSTKNDIKFGILENCVHCFCLPCIRRWRQDKSFGKIVRACPICRVHSNFVTPSNVWVEEEEKKKALIQDYKDAMRNKPCQYFKMGKGRCAFNEKCFYRHAYPDGTIAQPRPRQRRRRVNADGDESLVDMLNLWSFLEHRDSDDLDHRDPDDLDLNDELSLMLSLALLRDSDDEFYYNSDSDTDSLSNWGF